MLDSLPPARVLRSLTSGSSRVVSPVQPRSRRPQRTHVRACCRRSHGRRYPPDISSIVSPYLAFSARDVRWQARSEDVIETRVLPPLQSLRPPSVNTKNL